MKGMTFSAYYNALFAPKKRRPAAWLRRRLVQLRRQFPRPLPPGDPEASVQQALNGHLWAEFVWEGDYYAQRDMMTFLRAEVMFTF